MSYFIYWRTLGNIIHLPYPRLFVPRNLTCRSPCLHLARPIDFHPTGKDPAMRHLWDLDTGEKAYFFLEKRGFGLLSHFSTYMREPSCWPFTDEMQYQKFDLTAFYLYILYILDSRNSSHLSRTLLNNSPSSTEPELNHGPRFSSL